MTTLETLRNKYESYNPKANVYTFTIDYRNFDYINKLYDDLMDSDLFDWVMPHVNYDFSGNPFGYIECHIK